MLNFHAAQCVVPHVCFPAHKPRTQTPLKSITAISVAVMAVAIRTNYRMTASLTAENATIIGATTMYKEVSMQKVYKKQLYFCHCL